MLKLVNDPVSNVRLSLARILRYHFLNQINGPFSNDLEVNDAIRLLKKDKSRDVVELVEDIQTFPLNDDRELAIAEFIDRLNKLARYKKDEVNVQENNQEEQKKIESDLKIDSIIEDSKAMKMSNYDPQSK